MKKYILSAVAAVMALGLSAQQVRPVTIGDNMDYGLTYRIPLTAVEVTVDAFCTKFQPGQFAPYAEKFLGLKDVPQEASIHWEVTDIKMTPVALADTSRSYHIVFSEKGALPTFYLSSENTILGINAAPELPASVEKKQEIPAPKFTTNPADFMTSEMLKAGSKAKQAELVAEEIMAIRESRSELVRGEADNMPSDGKQLQLMLDNLSEQEASLLSLFVGVTTYDVAARHFTYAPREAAERELLFRFSRELGFVSNDDLAGAPYYMSLSVIEDNRMPFMDVKALKKLEKGIAFSVPGKAHIRLFNAAQTLAEGDLRMSQFGHVEQLPQAQFTDRKRPCAATFDAASGALHLFEQAAQ